MAVVALVLLAGSGAGIAPTAADDGALASPPAGTWLIGSRKVGVEIARCKDRAGICGKIIWLKKPYNRDGTPKQDDHADDPAKRLRLLCGLNVLRGFEPSGSDQWDGRVYNPKDGNLYSGDLRVETPDRLRVRAYIGIPLLGKAEDWVRFDPPADACTYPEEVLVSAGLNPDGSLRADQVDSTAQQGQTGGN